MCFLAFFRVQNRESNQGARNVENRGYHAPIERARAVMNDASAWDMTPVFSAPTSEADCLRAALVRRLLELQAHVRNMAHRQRQAGVDMWGELCLWRIENELSEALELARRI
jgi:hypothetical protein